MKGLTWIGVLLLVAWAVLWLGLDGLGSDSSAPRISARGVCVGGNFERTRAQRRTVMSSTVPTCCEDRCA